MVPLIGKSSKIPEGKITITYEQYLQEIHLLVVNLEKEMERELGKERAHELLRRAGDNFGKELARKQMGDRRGLRDFDEFKAFWKGILRTPTWTHTQDSKVVSENATRLKMRVDECLWAETFKKMGCPELGYLLCCYPDYEMVRTYDPRIRLERSKTLMLGDDHCNHVFIWKEDSSKSKEARKKSKSPGRKKKNQ